MLHKSADLASLQLGSLQLDPDVMNSVHVIYCTTSVYAATILPPSELSCERSVVCKSLSPDCVFVEWWKVEW